MSGIVREVTIGECRLILGDCRSVIPTLVMFYLLLLRPLNFHVARLAKAYQIIKGISFVSGRKNSEWFYVMDWYRITNKPTALLTDAAISINSPLSCGNPPLSPVCCYSANPLRRIFPRHAFFHVLRSAMDRTKPKSRFGFVLSVNPWFCFKRFLALSAISMNPLDYVHRLYLLRSERVRRSLSLPPFVSNLVLAWHGANRHMPLSSAFLAAKARRAGPVRLNFKEVAANFASFFNHADIIPQSMWSGTTGIAYRQATMFPATKQAAPHQNSLLEVTE